MKKADEEIAELDKLVESVREVSWMDDKGQKK